MLRLLQNMERKMLKSSDSGKKWNIKWWIFQIIGDSPLDATAKALYQSV